jgi:hypothetical protein
MNDPLLRLLDDLSPATLDASRADRIRAHCHAVLARRQRRMGGQRRAARLWTPMIAVLGGIYLTGVLHQVLALYGFVPELSVRIGV